MREIVIRPRALLDIDSVQIYLMTVTGDGTAAALFIERVYAAIEKLCDFPGMGRAVEGLSDRRCRRFLVDGKYWVFYTADEEELIVWRVLHTRQDFEDFAVLDW